MTNHRVEWKGPQPTVDEALEFADLGLPAMEYSNSYGRALRALAAEVRRLRGVHEPKCATCSATFVRIGDGYAPICVCHAKATEVEPRARTDAARLQWFEDQHGLHRELHVVYVVDGYMLQRLENDGNTVAGEWQAETLSKAIDAAMDAENREGGR